MTDHAQARREVQASLRAAVQQYLSDPRDPPAATSVDAVLGALDDLLYVAWPPRDPASPDGLHLALIEREGRRVILTGGVAMLYVGGGTHHRLRPMAADLSPDGAGTIRVASASEEVELRPSAELRFADQGAVRYWERTIRLPAADAAS